MIPGYVAGHYTFDQCHIDLCRLAMFAGARVIHAPCNHIDPAAKMVHFQGRPSIGYDCLSIDIGITPDSDIPGFKHVTPVKPINACVSADCAILLPSFWSFLSG
jgi:selenide,water dikinase